MSSEAATRNTPKNTLSQQLKKVRFNEADISQDHEEHINVQVTRSLPSPEAAYLLM